MKRFEVTGQVHYLTPKGSVVTRCGKVLPGGIYYEPGTSPERGSLGCPVADKDESWTFNSMITASSSIDRIMRSERAYKNIAFCGLELRDECEFGLTTDSKLGAVGQIENFGVWREYHTPCRIEPDKEREIIVKIDFIAGFDVSANRTESIKMCKQFSSKLESSYEGVAGNPDWRDWSCWAHYTDENGLHGFITETGLNSVPLDANLESLQLTAERVNSHAAKAVNGIPAERGWDHIEISEDSGDMGWIFYLKFVPKKPINGGDPVATVSICLPVMTRRKHGQRHVVEALRKAFSPIKVETRILA